MRQLLYQGNRSCLNGKRQDRTAILIEQYDFGRQRLNQLKGFRGKRAAGLTVALFPSLLMVLIEAVAQPFGLGCG